jgi:hypothetical protein
MPPKTLGSRERDRNATSSARRSLLPWLLLIGFILCALAVLHSDEISTLLYPLAAIPSASTQLHPRPSLKTAAEVHDSNVEVLNRLPESSSISKGPATNFERYNSAHAHKLKSISEERVLDRTKFSRFSPLLLANNTSKKLKKAVRQSKPYLIWENVVRDNR